MQTQPQTPSRFHLTLTRRSARPPDRMPRLLLGSVAAAAVLLAALALLGHWQTQAGAVAAVPSSTPPAEAESAFPVPAASEVLGAPAPVPDEPVSTF